MYEFEVALRVTSTRSARDSHSNNMVGRVLMSPTEAGLLTIVLVF